MLVPLYESSMACPYCDKKFTFTKVRPSFKKPFTSDTDFCGYYNKGVNPDYYVIRVCPTCGFSFSENSVTKPLTESQKSIYYQEVGRHWNEQHFLGERTSETALITYKRALMIGQLLSAPKSVLAGFLHHIAWIYRYMENEADEKRFLKFALECYVDVYEQESTSQNKARLLYLIGELNKRTGNYTEAVKWFSRVVNDKRIEDAAMIRASREQWKEIAEIIASEKHNTDN